MGNKSSKRPSQTKRVPQSTATNGKMMNDTKKVLILHKSSEDELKIVRNFRDALVSTANGGIRVDHLVNIAETTLSKDLSWLKQLHNVIVICLTRDGVTELGNIIREKGFVDNGHLYDKVFCVSFGNHLATGWQRNSMDVKDFAFDFDQVNTLRPQDFEKSTEMTTLVAAIKGTN